MKSKEVRQRFIEFFKERGHTVVPSASVVPVNDPTILFTNAGMNQFKPIFLGQQKPEFTRAVDTQKCIRVSGKHNDLEEVGVSAYHHTFFEMLGNWSFGDYFKKDAIIWGWELLTQGYNLPKDKLYATIYETDDEAEALWKSETDIDPSHVLRFGKKDNFWTMGDTGPCGPCSELHIDRGPSYDSDPNAFVNTGSPRYIELWNLVFIQYDGQKDGSLIPLPSKHVDTGAGLERITNVLSGVRSNYDTDLFQPLIQHIIEMSGKQYSADETGMAHRVIADHLRCLTFAIADGAMPGNEGRGYVLRRILRRAARYGRKLEMHEPFIYKLIPTLIDVMGEQFPEIKNRHLHVSSVIKAEEEHFGKTLDRGLDSFDKVVVEVRKNKSTEIPGTEVFKLYDTFGFPLDLTQLMAREQGLTVDESGFTKAMDEQKERARSAGKFEMQTGTTEFVFTGETENREAYLGQTVTSVQTKMIGYAKDYSVVFLQATPFYSESGGQVGDTGWIEHTESGTRIRIIDTKRGPDNRIWHYVAEQDAAKVEKLLKVTVNVQVDPAHRLPVQNNHTSTHLLQAALRETLGEHVHQTGSFVGPDYFRFDYSHFQKPTPDELQQIEERVNEFIRANWAVTPRLTTLKEAQSLGAMALFGEKYGDEVRLVEIGDGKTYISRELCGGCHVSRTGDIGLFVIKAETSAAAGIRRIEALTGDRALRYLLEARNKVDDFVSVLGSEGSDPLEKLHKYMDERKKIEKELEQLRSQQAGSAMKDLAMKATAIGKSKLVAAEVTALSLDQLKEMGDAIRDELGSGVGVLLAAIDGKPSMVIVVTPDLVKAGVDAVPMVKELGKFLQGGGGGKPHLATAGGKNLAGIKDVVANASGVILKYIS